MDNQVTKGLKFTLLAHGIMMTLFALIYIFTPVLWGNLTGCLSNQVPQVFRLFGISILGLAATSLLAYSEVSWEKIKIVVQMERYLSILFPIVILLSLLFWDLPAIGWMYFIILSGFGIAFNVFYPKT